MSLPEDVLKKLQDPALVLHVGDVWWVPNESLDYPRATDHFCVIAALEYGTDSSLARVHVIVGSTKRGGPPVIIVEAGEAGLTERTYFRFWKSCPVDPHVLVSVGKYKGRLSEKTQSLIVPTIRASKLSALKRLIK